MSILETINTPGQLNKLDEQQLVELAEEIRAYLLQVVSANGGHLAPNLGVVELTLALNRVFDFAKDRVIWDVGHQCYTQKIISGRRDNFKTLRQFEGLSGFPKRSESIYDAFDTGHASTSISAALGMAKARDLANQNYHVVAVIGDGAFTGGMTYEAMNHAGYIKTPLIVVLNDNKMSINRNVGALQKHLTYLRINPRYFQSKKLVERFLYKIPGVGKHLAHGLESIKNSFKYMLFPRASIFENMGFAYLGPVNGHNVAEVENILNLAKKLKRPVVVHIITEKGHGYEPAIKNPGKFHGIGPFDVANGQSLSNGPKVLTYTEAFADAAVKIAADDPTYIAITAAMADGTGLSQFKQHYPERFFDVGIAEQHAVTFAAGMAAQGFKPIVAIYSSFLQRAYDQVFHDVCLSKLPVIFALDRAGIIGEDGCTHQGIYDIAFLRHLPNLVLMAPKDEAELQQMLYSAGSYQCPVAIRYPRGKALGVALPKVFTTIPLGQAETLQAGSDLLILAIGAFVAKAQKVARLLAEQGVSAQVVNMRFIKPLDIEVLKNCAASKLPVVIMEEGVLPGGFGSACLEAWENLGGPMPKVMRFGLPDAPIQHGDLNNILKQLNLTEQQIAAQILAGL